MADRVLFPNAIDYIREINDNIVDNRLADRAAYTLFPSLYNRAYNIVHETGHIPLTREVIAPSEEISPKNINNIVNIITRNSQ